MKVADSAGPTVYLKPVKYLTARIATPPSFFDLQCRMFIFNTMIAYGVLKTIGLLDHRCDHGVKGQGHIYLKPVYSL